MPSHTLISPPLIASTPFIFSILTSRKTRLTTPSEPQTKMFHDMRATLNIPPTTDILTHITTLPPSAQAPALASIRAIETHYMRLQTPQPGLADLMTYLESRNVRKGICTRNFEGPVTHLLDKFLGGNGTPPELAADVEVETVKGVSGHDGARFYPIVTRDFTPPKPSPAGILHIARAWGLVAPSGEPDGSGLIMVGDSMDDMLAGRAAGAATVLLLHGDNARVAGSGAVDLVVAGLGELVGILEEGFEGVVGAGAGGGAGGV